MHKEPILHLLSCVHPAPCILHPCVPHQVISTSNDRIKVFPLMATDGQQQLRIVVINKLTVSAAKVTLRLGNLDNGGAYKNGRVVRMSAPGGLTATADVQLGGRTFSVGGIETGKEAAEVIARVDGSANSEAYYSLYMPAASAALLTISKWS